ncbi:glycosyltransferase family protein [Portibacter marinus]|uniref:hypothetical protein n=1 Tax=Portibacter marinus TaxID=2898660 RepID=UPI001F1D7169|nr:hypothetical protein [Portibacter marinus]
MKIDVAYMVSHGFAARMVTQTNLLGRLVEKGLGVALIAPDSDDINLKTYCEKYGIHLYEFRPKSNFWSDHYMKARAYFLEDINKNPALYEKYIYDIRSKHKSIYRWLRPRLLKITHDLKKNFPGIKKWYSAKESTMLESEMAYDLLKEINPQTVISTYPVNFSESMLLNAARKQSIQTVIHLLSWDNITCKGRFPHLADKYIAWGPIMKEELMEFYSVSEDDIYECGVPHFDIHLDSRLNPHPAPYLEELGLDRNKPYLFFGMSSPRFAPHEIDIVEWLAQNVEADQFGTEMQLIVRPHPQNVQGSMADESWLPRLKSLVSSRVGVDFPDLNKSDLPWSMRENDMDRMSNLLAGCSVSLNSGSTLSIDALMCGVPVVLTSFDGDKQLEYWKSARRLIDYTHLRKLVELGGVSVVENFEEMTLVLHRYLEDSSYNQSKRKETIRAECTFPNSTTNCVEVIQSFI